MALNSTPVTIAASGAETLPAGSMATSIYNTLKTDYEARAGDIPSGNAGVAAKQALADTANPIAAGIVANITANAEAVIPATAAADGLQRTPNPNNPDTDTQRPAAEKTLAIR